MSSAKEERFARGAEVGQRVIIIQRKKFQGISSGILSHYLLTLLVEYRALYCYIIENLP